MTAEALLSQPFKFLRHTITILVVDDQPNELVEITLGLAKIEFFNVLGVSTAREAVEIFQSSRRVHVCLSELSIRDINDDEFFLSKKYSSNTRFIGITRIRSCSMGYKAIRNGFSEVFDKPINLTELIRSTFRNAMINIFVPHSNPLQKAR